MLLRIYLNDHLAGATVAVELARRSRKRNRGNSFGEFLAWLTEQIDADRRTLRSLMDELEMRIDVSKQIAAWGSEKLGRLKLNGSLTGYSPLSRLIELEFLALGVAGKLAMWRVLQDSVGAPLGDTDLEALIDRAEHQRSELERHRVRAAEEVFS